MCQCLGGLEILGWPLVIAAPLRLGFLAISQPLRDARIDLDQLRLACGQPPAVTERLLPSQSRVPATPSQSTLQGRGRPPRQIRPVSDSYEVHGCRVRTPGPLRTARHRSRTGFASRATPSDNAGYATDLDRLLMPPRYRTVAYKIHVESAIAAERRRCKVAPPIARHQPTMERATEESSTRCEPMFDRCKTLSQPRCFDLAKPLVAPANYPTRTFQKFGAGIALV